MVIAPPTIIELDDGKIYRKALYLMVKTMVSCRCSDIELDIEPGIHMNSSGCHASAEHDQC